MMKTILVLLMVGYLATGLTAQQVRNRPQEPTAPYDYQVEDIAFRNEQAKNSLSGTLTLPTHLTDYPVVILISGSSPHNRNEEIAGHKPFLVIADYLTRKGIGVLRYDDRGVGQSEGTYEIAGYDDRISDVMSAIRYLKNRNEINQKSIGLIGHSEGGLIAAMVAEQAKEIDFIVLMAAPGLAGYEMMLLRTEHANRLQGVSEAETTKEKALLKIIFDVAIANNQADERSSMLSDSLLQQLQINPDQFPKDLEAEQLSRMVETFTSSWFKRILMSNPAASLKNVECPVLAINGGLDKQIVPQENLSAIRQALEAGKSKQFEVKEMPGLNHLFQEAETGLEEEFERIEQTISPIALTTIEEWIFGIEK